MLDEIIEKIGCGIIAIISLFLIFRRKNVRNNGNGIDDIREHIKNDTGTVEDVQGRIDNVQSGLGELESGLDEAISIIDRVKKNKQKKDN